MKILIALTFVLFASVFGVCQTKSPEKSAESEIKQVTVQETSEAVKQDDVQFIDVRTISEFAAGHAPKTVNLPLDKLENEISELDKTKPVYIICQTGRRSQKGAEILQKAGFKKIFNVKGGTAEWISAGLPTEN